MRWLRVQEPETDQAAGEPEERLLDLGVAVQAAAQPAERVQPRDGPLDDPAVHAQPAAVPGISGRQDRGDPQPPEPPPRRLGVVTAVPVQAVRLLSLGAGL